MHLIYKQLKKIFHLFLCFEQLPLNIKQKFEFPYHLNDGERLLSVVEGVVSFSVDKPLDIGDTTFSVSPSLFKYNKAFEISSKLLLHYLTQP